MGVTPEIRSIWSIDWDGEPFTDSAARTIEVRADIGPQGQRGADQFILQVCNRPWADQMEGRVHDWELTFLVLDRFDMDLVRARLQTQIDRLGPYDSWSDFAARLKPYLAWEGEGLT